MAMTTLIALVAIAFVGGVSITALGPGGIFLTYGLFALTELEPSVVAGTASATFIATGLLGSATYVFSGELASRQVMRNAMILGLGSVLGALGGAWVNTLLSEAVFGLLLGLFVTVTGVLVMMRRGGGAAEQGAGAGTLPLQWMLLLGLGVGFFGGMLGVGGPVIAVPLLVLLGTPMLVSVALAQVQSVFIAVFATLGYARIGAVDWTLAWQVGVPLLLGVWVGWMVARRLPEKLLVRALAVVLLGLGFQLVFSSVSVLGA